MKQYCVLVVILAFCTLFLAGCDKNLIFEDSKEIPAKQWNYDEPVQFSIEVTDTTTQYDLYINLRHTNEYAYRNLWVWVYTTFPSGKKMKQRVDLPLADKMGKWEGNGVGDIISAQVSIQDNAIFPEAGTYVFEIEQNMRLNPLEEVMDVGLRVEKAVE